MTISNEFSGVMREDLTISSLAQDERETNPLNIFTLRAIEMFKRGNVNGATLALEDSATQSVRFAILFGSKVKPALGNSPKDAIGQNFEVYMSTYMGACGARRIKYNGETHVVHHTIDSIKRLKSIAENVSTPTTNGQEISR